jgi:hypothetical protein
MNRMKLIAGCLVLLLAETASVFAQDPGWPRRIVKPGGTVLAYQPQVDEWKDFKAITWRQAFEMTPKGGKPVVGAATFTGTTAVDKDKHLVVIQNITVTHSYFPSLDEATSAKMDQLIKSFVPPVIDIALERVVASTPKTESVSTVQLKNDPPFVFVSYSPAILLAVDGEPDLAAIPNTKLNFVVNTQWPLFQDTSSKQYYLLVGQRWFSATDLHGPWSPQTKLSKEMEKLPKDAQWAEVKKMIPPPQATGPVPKIFYSTVPAEVILFSGKPVYAKIPQTQLVYATNTDSALFLYTPTNEYYFLAAGRWFRSKDLNGANWTFASLDLPADFAKIPRSSPASAILSSVPGTEEAKDAVLIAQIPTVMEIDAKSAAAQAKVTYNGDPTFAKIEGTSLSYATNTADKVIKVGDVYYLCLQGVWFMSSNPQGPWTTASSVPKEIYTIPPSSPVYNVTYVTQTTTPTGTVQSSYTAGYMGAFVIGATVGAIVANGTGYYYPPYIYHPPYGYPVYRPYPVPYGAYGYGSYYNTRNGSYGVYQTAYGPYGAATRAASYNPYTGTYKSGAAVATPYGSRSAGQAYNPYTGTYAATRQGSSPTAQWGQSYVSNGNKSAYTQHYSTAQGTVASAQGSQGGKAYGTSNAHGTTAVGKTSGGDVYAGHDGNVYKNTGEGWQKYDNGSWSTVDTQQAQQQKANSQQQAQQQKSTYQQQHATATQSSSANVQQQAQQQKSTRQQPTTTATQTSTAGAQQRQQSASQSRTSGGMSTESLNSEMQNRQRGAAQSQTWQRGGGSSAASGGGGRTRSASGGGGRRR